MKESTLKNTIACIIVRMKSTRLPKKAILDLGGYELTFQLIRRLRLSKTISKIVICTSDHPDDAIFFDLAKKWNVECYFGDQNDVLSRLIDVSQKYSADAVIRITGDNPFTDSENIDRLVHHHFLKSSEYTRTNRLPLGVTAEVMDTHFLKKLHSSMPDPNQSEYMSFFAFNPEKFHCEVLEPDNSLDRPYYSLTVDYPEDIEMAREIYNAIGRKEYIPRLTEVIDFLEKSGYQGVDKDKIIKLPNDKEMTYEQLISMLDKDAELSRKKNLNQI